MSKNKYTNNRFDMNRRKSMFDIINFEEVKSITAFEYFNGDKYAVDVFNVKYAKSKVDGTKETPAEVFMRVAAGLAELEDSTDTIVGLKHIWFSLMWLGWFRPGGSVITGVGTNKKISLNNCTTVPLHEDTIEAIAQTRYWLKKVAAYRQGVGFDASSLRPRGALVNNAAEESTGTIPWIDDLVNIGKKVGQKGRMPALLVSLKVSHPDIEEFISCKDELDQITNANISVQITDAFMDAVIAESDWELTFEVSSTGEKISRKVKARELFNKIAEHAYKSAEPGVQYIDKMRLGSMVHSVYLATGDERFKIISTNACCIPSDTRVFTDTGISTIGKMLDNRNFKVLTDNGVSSVEDIIEQPIKDVYTLYTKEGVELPLTADHKVKLIDGSMVEAGKLKKGDRIAIPSGYSLSKVDTKEFDLGFLLGYMLGDGYLASKKKTFGFSVSNEEMEVYNEMCRIFNSLFDFDLKPRTHIKKGCVQVVVSNAEIYENLLSYGLKPCSCDEKVIPELVYTSVSSMIGCLQGLLQADGCVNYKRANSLYVGFDNTSLTMVKQVQELLLYFGITSTIYKYRRNTTTTMLPDNNRDLAEYPVKQIHSLRITRSSIAKYNNKVGFLVGTYKSKHLVDIISNHNLRDQRNYFTFDSISYRSTEVVYDVTNSEHKVFTANGLVVSNSEKPLAGHSVCNLLSINMEMFSTDPAVYVSQLEQIVPYLVRLSDNVVTYELTKNRSPLEEQKAMVELLREVGLGVTNVHGWLLKDGIAYDSDKAVEMVENFFKWYAYNVFITSMILGQEKGNAPAFDLVEDKSAFMQSDYFRNIVNEFFDGDPHKVTSMRNMAHMSVAPSGSISSVFPLPCMSSGIEPIIGFYYWRRTRAINKGNYTHYFVIPNRVKQFILDNIEKGTEDYNTLAAFSGSEPDEDGKIGKKLVSIINKYMPEGLIKPAHAVDPLKKVELMAAAYKWVDAAISCTYNLPVTATVSTVEDIYMEAYKKGVRAVSVYVENSREGILIFEDPVTNKAKYEKSGKQSLCENGDRPAGIVHMCAPKRPKELPCNIHHCSVKGVPWLVVVGMMGNDPYEIFAGEAVTVEDSLYVPKSCKTGKIIKSGGGTYSLEIVVRNSEVVYKDIAHILMTSEQRALTRLISLSMRHGTPLEFIQSQLKKANGEITDFSSVVARVLGTYIKQYRFTKFSDNKCPVCGEPAMVRSGGCAKCEACGYSRCD